MGMSRHQVLFRIRYSIELLTIAAADGVDGTEVNAARYKELLDSSDKLDDQELQSRLLDIEKSDLPASSFNLWQQQDAHKATCEVMGYELPPSLVEDLKRRSGQRAPR